MLVAALGLVGCLAGIWGIWIAHQQLSEKVPAVSARLDGALERASAVNQGLRRGLERAEAELAKVNKESVAAGGGDLESRVAADVLRVGLRKRVGPRMSELREKLATFSDASVVVTSLLRSLQEMASDQIIDIRPDNLERATHQASQVSAALRKFQSVVGDGDKATSLKDYAAAEREVDLVLRRCLDTVNDWQSDLDSLRERLSGVKAKALDWLTPLAVAMTLVCLWLAVSQISVFVHALRWVRTGKGEKGVTTSTEMEVR
jgi:hypothetical protein